MRLYPRSIMNLVVTLGIALVVVVLFLRWYEPRLLYYPLTALDATPAAAGLPYEDVRLTTTDGVSLHGWFVPHPAAGPAVLFLHGNAGNISHRLEKLQLLHQLGAQVLILDYRGYGQSDGIPAEQGTYRDAETAYHWLRARTPRGVTLYGESLGAAIAVELATRQPVDKLILEEPFTSVAAMGQRLFPFVPVRWIVRNRYDSLAKIPGVRVPLLVIHSRDDEIVPFRQGQQLFAAANEPKTFATLRGGHNDAFLVSAADYREALRAFLADGQP